MDYGVDTCLIDIPTLFGSRHSDQILDDMQDAMLTMGGRPHWGKINNRGIDMQKNFYPKYAQWSAVRAKLDPLKIFSNDFTRRLE